MFTYLDEVSYTSTGDYNNYFKITDNDALTLPNKFELTFELKGNSHFDRFGLIKQNYSQSDSSYGFYVQVSFNDYVGVLRATSTTGLNNGRLSTDNTQYHECKISRDGNTFTWLLGGTNSASSTVTWTDNYVYHLVFWLFESGGQASVRNVKLKAL